MTKEWTPGKYPSVSAIIPTRDRPEFVTRAVRAVLTQDYPGTVECIVVFDQCEPHAISVNTDGDRRRLVLLRNVRTPGLAGARNSGVLAASGEVVGFCDDDDEWLAGKLTRQFELWRTNPGAPVVATGIQIRNDDGDHDRPAPSRATFEDFLQSRIMEINPCTLLVRRSDLTGRIGLVDEEIPSSFGEDYEWLLRATRYGDVIGVPAPLVRINWNRPSFFVGKWASIAAGLSYILDAVPEFHDAPRGRARIEGQIAFANAAIGRRSEAIRWALRALRHDPHQLRAFGALAVSARLASAEWLVRRVQARGRGL